MTDNWLALCIAILRKVNVEQAFLLLKNPETKSNGLGRTITEEDMEDIFKLKEEMSVRELAEAYGMKVNSMYVRMTREKRNKVGG